MARVEFVQATRKYPGGEAPAIDALNLDVANGEFVVLVGPSGSGKSTALRMLAGLEPVDSGKILIGGRDVTNVLPKDRDIAMVFQSYALYPHMTAADNIAFHLRLKGVPKAERRQRVVEVARLLDIEPLLDRKPSRLSGGQRQRVAMGRALIRHPQVFLMDEPLSNLDAKLRVATRTEIASLQRRLGVTTVYVTHDQVEAMTMGDRVAVLKEGVLQQCASPRVLFDRPSNVFVAGFIGSPAMNLLEASVDSSGLHLGNVQLDLTPSQRRVLTSGSAVVGLRPESWTIVAEGAGIRAVVELVEELGPDSYCYARALGHEPWGLLAVRLQPEEPVPGKGATIDLRPKAHAAHIFDLRTGVRVDD